MEAVRSLVKQGALPTAILCGNDLIALGAISVLEQLGVRVPEDVSVVGFDDIVFARLATPPLTTVAVPREKLGRTAFEALHALQRAKTRKAAHHTIGTQLIVRASTAPARAHDTVARAGRLNSRSAASR
jgi:LacI family transcriptional regulator